MKKDKESWIEERSKIIYNDKGEKEKKEEE